MIVFEEIFNRVTKLEKKNSGNINNITDILPFSMYFNSLVFKTSNNYSWEKYIKYKFFILNNFLRIKCNYYINNTFIQQMLELFCKVQKHVISLYKFKNICLFKTKKYLGEQQDMNFNLLREMKSLYTIDIIQEGIKYQFSIFDLIRIINTSLSYEFNFFTDPKEIKNPWNNIPFTHANLYNIYFYIQSLSLTTNIKMPILFARFFESNFCLKHYENHNQLIIKKYVIEHFHTFSKTKKLNYIYNMIDSFNIKRLSKFHINIDHNFPENKLLETMEPFLKLHLLANYSYDDDLLRDYRNKLSKKLRIFRDNNPLFGRRISVLQIHKLYYISCLYHIEKIPIFVVGNIYIPPPDLICIKKRCYYIGEYTINNYSSTPNFEKNTEKIHLDIRGLFPFIKNFVFAQHHNNIIKTKYKIKHSVDSDISHNSVNTNRPIVNNIIIDSEDNSEDDSEYDSEYDNEYDNEYDSEDNSDDIIVQALEYAINNRDDIYSNNDIHNNENDDENDDDNNNNNNNNDDDNDNDENDDDNNNNNNNNDDNRENIDHVITSRLSIDPYIICDVSNCNCGISDLVEILQHHQLLRDNVDNVDNVDNTIVGFQPDTEEFEED